MGLCICFGLQGQASSKGLEVELLRKKLSAADANISTLRSDLAEAQQESAALRGQVQDMESVAGESQAAAEEQVSCAGVCWRRCWLRAVSKYGRTAGCATVLQDVAENPEIGTRDPKREQHLSAGAECCC